MRASLPFCALGAGVLFSAAGAGERLQFAPPAGASVTKTFVSEGEFALDELSLVADGQDVGAMIGSIEISMETRSRIEVTDLYRAVSAGRPTELVRTFDGLESHTKMNMSQIDAIPEIEASSELAGRSVLFRWNPETSDYELSFHESEGEASLLEGLEEDMDLRFLLPQEEVAPEGSWEVELGELGALMMPGGNLRMMPADAAADPEAMAMMEGLMDTFGDKMGEGLEGHCRCTFKGLRTGDEARLAEVELELELAATLDLREFLLQAVRTGIAQSGQELDVDFDIATADLSADYEGTGMLLWDTAAGRVHSLTVQGDLTVGIDIDVSIDAMGESHSMEAAMEMSGEWRLDVTTGD